MIFSSILKRFTKNKNSHPVIFPYTPTGPFSKLKIALIADYFTVECLNAECQIKEVLPSNYKAIFQKWHPDLLLAESAFHAGNDSWKNKIAEHSQKGKNNKDLVKVVAFAKSLGIPTVFWNKDDSAHFDRFINSAELFDHIFTTDSNCIHRYKERVPEYTTAEYLMIPYQPAFHNFTGFNFKYDKASFAGTYYANKYDRRRTWQQMMFEGCRKINIPLVIFDRNAGKNIKAFNFPSDFNLEIKSSVPHYLTADIYKDYSISLNVNTIEDSPTMYSRRLVEILACGGILVTTPSLAVETHFKEYCHVINNIDESVELFERLKHGPSKDDMERAEAGAKYVASNHTWEKRLEQICNTIKTL